MDEIQYSVTAMVALLVLCLCLLGVGLAVVRLFFHLLEKVGERELPTRRAAETSHQDDT